MNAEQNAVADQTLQYATFYVGEQLMGVDLTYVHEINRHVEATPVPRAPAFVRGVINLRGEVVTVLDLRAVLGLDVDGAADEPRCVVIDAAGEKTGLLVDRVADVLALCPAQIDPPPANIGGVDGRRLSGVCRLEEELLVILDVRALWDTQTA